MTVDMAGRKAWLELHLTRRERIALAVEERLPWLPILTPFWAGWLWGGFVEACEALTYHHLGDVQPWKPAQ